MPDATPARADFDDTFSRRRLMPLTRDSAMTPPPARAGDDAMPP